MNKKLVAIIIGLSTLFVSACTPEQIAVWNRLTPEQQAQVVENCNVGWQIAQEEGLSVSEFACVDRVVMGESAWANVPNAAGGSAYGIPQALPGRKMASHGSDWATNVRVQIRWMLDYMLDRYGSFCGAWKFKQAKGWY